MLSLRYLNELCFFKFDYDGILMNRLKYELNAFTLNVIIKVFEWIMILNLMMKVF